MAKMAQLPRLVHVTDGGSLSESSTTSSPKGTGFFLPLTAESESKTCKGENGPCRASHRSEDHAKAQSSQLSGKSTRPVTGIDAGFRNNLPSARRNSVTIPYQPEGSAHLLADSGHRTIHAGPAPSIPNRQGVRRGSLDSCYSAVRTGFPTGADHRHLAAPATHLTGSVSPAATATSKSPTTDLGYSRGQSLSFNRTPLGGLQRSTSAAATLSRNAQQCLSPPSASAHGPAAFRTMSQHRGSMDAAATAAGGAASRIMQIPCCSSANAAFTFQLLQQQQQEEQQQQVLQLRQQLEFLKVLQLQQQEEENAKLQAESDLEVQLALQMQQQEEEQAQMQQQQQQIVLQMQQQLEEQARQQHMQELQAALAQQQRSQELQTVLAQQQQQQLVLQTQQQLDEQAQQQHMQELQTALAQQQQQQQLVLQTQQQLQEQAQQHHMQELQTAMAQLAAASPASFQDAFITGLPAMLSPQPSFDGPFVIATSPPAVIAAAKSSPFPPQLVSCDSSGYVEISGSSFSSSGYLPSMDLNGGGFVCSSTGSFFSNQSLNWGQGRAGLQALEGLPSSSIAVSQAFTTDNRVVLMMLS